MITVVRALRCAKSHMSMVLYLHLHMLSRDLQSGESRLREPWPFAGRGNVEGGGEGAGLGWREAADNGLRAQAIEHHPAPAGELMGKGDIARTHDRRYSALSWARQ